MATVEKGQPTAVPGTEHDPNYGQGEHMDQSQTDRIVKGDKVELQDSDAWECLGYSFKTWRKWCVQRVLSRFSQTRLGLWSTVHHTD